MPNHLKMAPKMTILSQNIFSWSRTRMSCLHIFYKNDNEYEYEVDSISYSYSLSVLTLSNVVVAETSYQML